MCVRSWLGEWLGLGIRLGRDEGLLSGQGGGPRCPSGSAVEGGGGGTLDPCIRCNSSAMFRIGFEYRIYIPVLKQRHNTRDSPSPSAAAASNRTSRGALRRFAGKEGEEDEAMLI